MPKDLAYYWLLLPPGFRQPYGASAEPWPGFDSIGLAAIQWKSHFPMNRRRRYRAACPRGHPHRQDLLRFPCRPQPRGCPPPSRIKNRPSHIDARAVAFVIVVGRWAVETRLVRRSSCGFQMATRRGPRQQTDPPANACSGHYA